MISIKTILFDLDGTLIDPKLGIIRSILYALERMGVQISPNDSLDWCIGPPLKLSMQKLLSSTDEGLAERAVGYFAERFETVGKYEGSVYPGTSEALRRIRQMGMKLYLATSKPQFVAIDILKHFGLDGYFDGAYGSLDDKGTLIEHILKVESIDPTDALMVGDREHDVIGAQKCLVRSAAVTYGYGSEAELKAAKPNYIFDSLGDLVNSLEQVE